MKQYLPYLIAFRKIAFWEGVSYLILLFVAMPLKYLMGIPEAVKVVGMLHGVLFVLFCLLLLTVWMIAKWSLYKTARAFMLSLIPFGTFVLEKEIKKEEKDLLHTF